MTQELYFSIKSVEDNWKNTAGACLARGLEHTAQPGSTSILFTSISLLLTSLMTYTFSNYDILNIIKLSVLEFEAVHS